ncbi:ADP-ribosylglycohydrolase family protein [Candidatus Sumerlaeota bacterium]|nr:ADP-ribosylglycohydrolase family protein [Candidatus Sumerlaeota bacterium]
MPSLKKNLFFIILICGLLSGTCLSREFRRIPVEEYMDKMKAGWIGQMAGVGWGAPTEFRALGFIIPERYLPEWRPEIINQFYQDDLYVEMTFLRTLETRGLNASMREAGIDFARSGYPLWHANKAGRCNLRHGIAPPDSGHPKFNRHSDDIDYQIEADFSGLISPGMLNRAIKLGETFGRLMNYGDGVYGGQFIGAMYSEAFFEKDMVKIVEAGLNAIPQGCQYHECISDVLKWYKENPENWEKTWRLIEDKYNRNPEYRRSSCSLGAVFNIDAKINGAYVVMGVLYGKRDPDKTIMISTQCGQDSDCNPSSAAGILFTTIGYENLPDRFTSALNMDKKFSHTPYDFRKLCSVCETLARKTLLSEGGKIEKNEKGEEVFFIPFQSPAPGALEQSWNPAPEQNSRFTETEMADMASSASLQSASDIDISKAVAEFAPGWKIIHCGNEMNPGLRQLKGSDKKILATHPKSELIPCVLSRNVDVPEGKKTILTLIVGRHLSGDWVLVVKVDGKMLVKNDMDEFTCRHGFTTIPVDLSPYAGKTIRLELEHRADGWNFEGAFWFRIELRSE